jgi:hypothetical protein
VGQVSTKPTLENEDYLYLFFTETDAARAAGLASLRRLDYRLHRSHAEVTLEQVMAQTAAIRTYEGLWAACRNSNFRCSSRTAPTT